MESVHVRIEDKVRIALWSLYKTLYSFHSMHITATFDLDSE